MDLTRLELDLQEWRAGRGALFVNPADRMNLSADFEASGQIHTDPHVPQGKLLFVRYPDPAPEMPMPPYVREGVAVPICRGPMDLPQEEDQ